MSEWIYSIAESYDLIIKNRKDSSDLFGAKGQSLIEMSYLDIPVPPGFIITTKAANAYLADMQGSFDELWKMVQVGITGIEVSTGKKFEGNNPLLLCCRSGIEYSTSSTQRYVSNIGLTEEILYELIQTNGEWFAWDAYRRLIHSFCVLVLNKAEEKVPASIANTKRLYLKEPNHQAVEETRSVVNMLNLLYKEVSGSDFPQDPYDQLQLAIKAGMEGWNDLTAAQMRRYSHNRERQGKPVSITSMVFGTLGDKSGSGVVLTRSTNGDYGNLEGDYLPNVGFVQSEHKMVKTSKMCIF
jgi:pyruvate,orthophosphate dikinase